MITLVETGCDARIQHIFENVRQVLSHEFRAAYWRGGHGPANPFMPSDGCHPLYAIRIDGSRTACRFSNPGDGLGAVEIAIGDVLDWFFMDGYSADAAIILRRNAIIVLHGQKGDADLYITAPGLSAHERIADQVALEAEFPNTFRIV